MSKIMNSKFKFKIMKRKITKLLSLLMLLLSVSIYSQDIELSNKLVNQLDEITKQNNVGSKINQSFF